MKNFLILLLLLIPASPALAQDFTASAFAGYESAEDLGFESGPAVGLEAGIADARYYARARARYAATPKYTGDGYQYSLEGNVTYGLWKRLGVAASYRYSAYSTSKWSKDSTNWAVGPALFFDRDTFVELLLNNDFQILNARAGLAERFWVSVEVLHRRENRMAYGLYLGIKLDK